MSTIFGNKIISERFVHTFGVLPVWTEGDKFTLKDVDGGPPTGEYTIAAIKVQIVRLAGSITTVTRVWFCADPSGAWTRDVNCVPVRSE